MKILIENYERTDGMGEEFIIGKLEIEGTEKEIESILNKLDIY